MFLNIFKTYKNIKTKNDQSYHPLPPPSGSPNRAGTGLGNVCHHTASAPSNTALAP